MKQITNVQREFEHRQRTKTDNATKRNQQTNKHQHQQTNKKTQTPSK